MHAAFAVKDGAAFNRDRPRRDVAVDDRSWTQFDTVMRDYVSIDGSTDDADSNIYLGVNASGCVDNQRSFRRNNLAADMAVNAQHVLKTQFAIKLRLRFGPWSLLNRQR